VLDLIERKKPLKNLCLFDHVSAIKHISRDQSLKWIVELESGRTISAIDLQREYLIPAQKYLKGKDEETDWILAQWEQVLDALERDHTSLTDKIDWVAKKWLLQTFMESERLKWGDPWLESLDLEYHNIDQRKGLYYELERKGAMQRVTTDNQIQNAIKSSPKNTRAKARVHIMRELFRRKIHHIVDWDLIHSNFGESFDMKDPFETYDNEVSSFLKRLSKTPSRPPGTPEAKRSRRY
jgi:proteasome accessory factor A